ncbi:hypothetical protein PHLCEN_2v1850 [Hermanssonia centrifuga]|uniref:EF-hand domain-containing protein n=1 Tax=Hermanssonia centrifuga TaxID=98765 RepID=A0A2R6RVR4_9APHY|nr:hypothetical protein PHLCEN_2v1850 [Hermanssonia centrifuga]
MSAPPQWSLTAFDTALEAHIKSLTKHEKRLIEGSQPDFETISHNIALMDTRHKRSHTYRFLYSMKDIYRHFNKFSDFLKDALSAAPFYVGLIFRSITYIMQLAETFVQYFGQISTNLEVISQALASFETYDKVLFTKWTRVKQALVNIYSSIFQYFTQTIRVFKRPNGESRCPLEIAWRTIILPDKSLDEIMQHFQQYKKNLNGEVKVAEQRRQRILDFTRTLGQFEYKARYEQLQETPRMQPGAWLFELPQFDSWLNGSNGQTVKLVWCYGTGHSNVIKHLDNISNSNGQMITYAYFFCGKDDKREQTALTIMRCILLQLIHRLYNLDPSWLADVILQSDTIPQLLNRADVRDYIIRIAPLLGKIFIVVDGLNQLSPDAMKEVASDLCNLIHGAGNLRVIVFTRDHQYIRNAFEPCYSYNAGITGRIACTRYSAPEVKRFIKLELMRRKFQSDDIRQHVEDGVEIYAEGIYLKAKLAIDDICHERPGDFAPLRKLRHLSYNGRVGMYHKSMAYINGLDEERSARAGAVLDWVCLAACPLTPEELAHAIAVGEMMSSDVWLPELVPDADKLLNDCAGLCVQRRGKVVIADSSVADFITTALSNKDVERERHYKLFQRCLQYQKLHAQMDPPNGVTRGCLSSYVYWHSFHHCHRAGLVIEAGLDVHDADSLYHGPYQNCVHNAAQRLPELPIKASDAPILPSGGRLQRLLQLAPLLTTARPVSQEQSEDRNESQDEYAYRWFLALDVDFSGTIDFSELSGVLGLDPANDKDMLGAGSRSDSRPLIVPATTLLEADTVKALMSRFADAHHDYLNLLQFTGLIQFSMKYIIQFRRIDSINRGLIAGAEFLQTIKEQGFSIETSVGKLEYMAVGLDSFVRSFVELHEIRDMYPVRDGDTSTVPLQPDQLMRICVTAKILPLWDTSILPHTAAGVQVEHRITTARVNQDPEHYAALHMIPGHLDVAVGAPSPPDKEHYRIMSPSYPDERAGAPSLVRVPDSPPDLHREHQRIISPSYHDFTVSAPSPPDKEHYRIMSPSYADERAGAPSLVRVPDSPPDLHRERQRIISPSYHDFTVSAPSPPDKEHYRIMSPFYPDVRVDAPSLVLGFSSNFLQGRPPHHP